MRLALSAALASTLLLAGCQTTSVPTSPIVNIGVGLLPENIQQHVVNACNWLEPVQSIAAIVASLGGYAVPDIANQVAAEICSAVQPRVSARRATVRRTVNGVVLRGRYVA